MESKVGKFRLRLSALSKRKHNNDELLSLRPRSSRSYHATNTPALHDFLVQHGYQAVPGHAATEYARLHKAGSLIVLYHRGSVLLQGADLDMPRHLLAPLVVGGK